MILAALLFSCVFATASIDSGKLSELISHARLTRGYMAKSVDEDVSEVMYILAQLHYPKEWNEGVIALLKANHKVVLLQQKTWKPILNPDAKPASSHATSAKYISEMEKIYLELARSTITVDFLALMVPLYKMANSCKAELKKIASMKASPLHRGYLFLGNIEIIYRETKTINTKITESLVDYAKMYPGDNLQVAKAAIAFDGLKQPWMHVSAILSNEADYTFNRVVSRLGRNPRPSSEALRSGFLGKGVAHHVDDAEVSRHRLFRALCRRIAEKPFSALDPAEVNKLIPPSFATAQAEQERHQPFIHSSSEDYLTQKKVLRLLVADSDWYTDSPKLKSFPGLEQRSQKLYATALVYRRLEIEDARLFSRIAEEISSILFKLG